MALHGRTGCEGMDKEYQNTEIQGGEIFDSEADASHTSSIHYSPIELDQISISLDEIPHMDVEDTGSGTEDRLSGSDTSTSKLKTDTRYYSGSTEPANQHIDADLTQKSAAPLVTTHLGSPFPRPPILTESADIPEEASSTIHRNIPGGSPTHSRLSLDSREGASYAEESNGLTSFASQPNVSTPMDFDPFSILPSAQLLMKSILQPPDAFTIEVFQDWLLLVTLEGMNFIKNIPENPSSFMQLSHAHRNLCLGWFAFFCNHVPRTVLKHPNVKACILLARDNHDFLADFCQRLQQCLQQIFDVDPHHVTIYHTWCQFYSSL